LDQLLQKALRLETEAQLIFEDLNLDSFFKEYGQVQPVGSMTYGLMTWEDIDIDLITEDIPSDELFWKIAKFLLKNKHTRLLMLADNRTGLRESNRPKSMYFGLKYEDDDNVEWKIDIRLIQRKEVKTLPGWMRSIDNDKRTTIIQIKDRLKDDPRYHRTISSVDVYDAVINHKISSYDLFLNWIENR